MRDEKRPPVNERLPIKLIMPKQGSERKVTGGGGPAKPLRTVDAKYRTRLSNQVSALRDAIVPQLQQSKTAPVRVKLIPTAVAKSHRPENLFSAESCPIIGAGRLGELFVKATPQGLDRLTQIIEHNKSERMAKELACVDAIEPVTPVFRRGGMDATDVLRRSPRGEHGFITRVRLFNYGTDNDQPKLVHDFEATCRKRNIVVTRKGYSASSFTYQIECRNIDDVEALSRVIGVRSILNMPLIRTIQPRMFNAKPLPKLPISGDVIGDFPVVVVVDSGVSDQIPELKSWIVGRDSQVAPQYQNTDHGSFVAGLVCWGSTLNPTVGGLDDSPCGIFDLQVLPNGDPAKGDVLELLESEFLVSLEVSLKEHANKYDVLRPGYFLEWRDFPYPPSLHRDGKYFGEIWMTVAFSPTRGARWGTEYCETHIDAHFGVYRRQKSRETGAVTTKFVGLVPPEHKNPGVLHESYQVEKLRKWAPVRTYYGNLDEKGERGDQWRLKLQLLTRHGIEDEQAFKPQPFSLIITIADPEKKVRVYDEMAQIVRNRFQAQNLTVRAAARIRAKQ